MTEDYLKIIAQKEKEIKVLRKALSKSEGTRSHFISNIRNEIINPFASINGLASLIVKSKKEDWKNVISIASMIHKEAFILDFQLANIFVAAEIESGESQVEFYKSNLGDLIQTEIEKYKVYAGKRDIHIEVNKKDSEDEFAISDLGKLKIIFVNLLMNAVNFSNNESKIIIDYHVDSENINFSVQDFGIGLTNENREYIFNRFSKGNTEINSINIGLGLGLSVVAGYLELLNGTLNIESENKKGAKFIVNIPIPEIGDGDLFTASSENEFFFDDDGDDEIF